MKKNCIKFRVLQRLVKVVAAVACVIYMIYVLLYIPQKYVFISIRHFIERNALRIIITDPDNAFSVRISILNYSFEL